MMNDEFFSIQHSAFSILPSSLYLNDSASVFSGTGDRNWALVVAVYPIPEEIAAFTSVVAQRRRGSFFIDSASLAARNYSATAGVRTVAF